MRATVLRFTVRFNRDSPHSGSREHPVRTVLHQAIPRQGPYWPAIRPDTGPGRRRFAAKLRPPSQAPFSRTKHGYRTLGSRRFKRPPVDGREQPFGKSLGHTLSPPGVKPRGMISDMPNRLWRSLLTGPSTQFQFSGLSLSDCNDAMKVKIRRLARGLGRLWRSHLVSKLYRRSMAKPEPKRKRFRYTKEQTQEVIERYQGGESLEEIALIAETSVPSVRGKFMHAGVYVPRSS